jgi:Ca-activated chloride channel homolog
MTLKLRWYWIGWTWLALALLGRSEEVSSNKTLSPYFWVKPVAGADTSDSAADVLPLKSTTVQATVAGIFAEVKVTQRYSNAGSVPLEAVYIFPGSTRAAVHGLTMTLGERRIEAKVKEREAARKTYEEAKSAGKTASLLEQHRPNVFQMNVANILPGDEVTVELRYTEMLVPTEGVYEFTYPGVVGPRYSNRPENAPAAHQWVANPYLKKGDADPAAFSLNVKLVSGSALQDVQCRTHQVEVKYEAETAASIRSADTSGSNRDFVLSYRLAGAAVQSGLLLAEGKEEKFFLLTVQPPARPTAAQIPPREYVFIVDVSGSMNGFPLKTAKRLMAELLGTLRPQDRFNVLLFAGGNEVLAPASLPADAASIRRGLDLLEKQSGSGATELLPALRTAFSLPAPDSMSRSFVIVTDGYVDVEAEAFDLVRSSLAKANVFAFGIGSSVNRHLIEGLARCGQGEPFIVTDAELAEPLAKKFAKYVSTPVLTRVTATFEGFNAYDVEPVSLPDVLADRPVIVFGKWRGQPQGKIVLSGISGGGAYRSDNDVFAAKRLENADGLSRLWARSRIARLDDLAGLNRSEDHQGQITSLGVTYNLLTRFTSFVAVDEVVRRTTPTLETVKQPLALPAGVENSAVGGGSVGAAPEPSSVVLGALAALAIALVAWRNRGKARTAASEE